MVFLQFIDIKITTVISKYTSNTLKENPNHIPCHKTQKKSNDHVMYAILINKIANHISLSTQSTHQHNPHSETPHPKSKNSKNKSLQPSTSGGS